MTDLKPHQICTCGHSAFEHTGVRGVCMTCACVSFVPTKPLFELPLDDKIIAEHYCGCKTGETFSNNTDGDATFQANFVDLEVDNA